MTREESRTLFNPDEYGKVYEPPYIRKRADLKYGEPVTHELFNDYMNENITQGDYNTAILHLWNTNPNPTEVPHILYIDETMQHIYDEHWKLSDSVDERFKDVNDHLDKHDKILDDHEQRITQNRTDIDDHYDELTNRIDMIINGPTIVAHADVADHLSSIVNAGPYQYYGTNKDGLEGYWDIPPAIFARDLDEHWKSPGGAIIVEPSYGSVTYNMLNEYLKGKIDDITRNYNDLDNKPWINGHELKGKMSLYELGIQPAGNYLTSIPDDFPDMSDINNLLSNYMNRTDLANTYATINALNELKSTVNNNKAEADSSFARVFINSFPSGYTPKNGDMVVYI